MGGCNTASTEVATQEYLHSCEALFLVLQIGQIEPVQKYKSDALLVRNLT